MVELAQQADPPKLTDVFLFWDMRLCSKLRAMAQVSKQIAANSPIKPKEITVAAKSGGREKKAAPPKRSWNAPELNDAIREYVAQRSKRYQEFISILDSPNEPPKRKRTAKREARKMFGRNVIAEALGVKSARMVSQSSAWIAVAAALDFTLKRDQIGKSAGSPKKIGLDIAVEKAAVRDHAEAGDASDEGLSDLAERSSTTRLIHQYSESGLPDAATVAAALLEKYQDGEMTDEQVRDTISTLKTSYASGEAQGLSGALRMGS